MSDPDARFAVLTRTPTGWHVTCALCGHAIEVAVSPARLSRTTAQRELRRHGWRWNMRRQAWWCPTCARAALRPSDSSCPPCETVL